MLVVHYSCDKFMKLQMCVIFLVRGWGLATEFEGLVNTTVLHSKRVDFLVNLHAKFIPSI